MKNLTPEQVDALIAFAVAHEQWEAKLLMSDKAWNGGQSSFPMIVDEHYDGLMEVQALRNDAIGPLRASGMVSPPEQIEGRL